MAWCRGKETNNTVLIGAFKSILPLFTNSATILNRRIHVFAENQSLAVDGRK